MLEATKYIEILDQLKAQHQPMSYMEQIRHMLEHPNIPVFTEEQRQVFVNNIDFVNGFLASTDGALSVEFLVDAFNYYVAANTVEAEEENTKSVAVQAAS